MNGKRSPNLAVCLQMFPPTHGTFIAVEVGSTLATGWEKVIAWRALRRSHSERCQTAGSACGAGQQVRVGDQPQDRQGDRCDGSRGIVGASRQGDRVGLLGSARFKLRQLDDVGGDASRVVAGEQMRCRPPACRRHQGRPAGVCIHFGHTA